MRGTIIGRRALIGAALLVAGAGAATAQTTITVNGSGGTLAEAIKRVYETPFTQETGIRVRATAPVSLPKLKAMVQTGNMEWDVTELSGDFYPTVVKEGWVTKIDWSRSIPTRSCRTSPVGNTD
jgi:putative spermidine/putrescine transport system substrate-binding protein